MRENHRQIPIKNKRTQKGKRKQKFAPENFSQKPALRRRELCQKNGKGQEPDRKRHKREKRTAFPPSTKGRASEQMCDRTCPRPSERICVTIRLPPPFPLPAPTLGDCGREWGEHRQLRTDCPGRCPMLFPQKEAKKTIVIIIGGAVW